MRLFWRKEREYERNGEDSRTNEVQSTTNKVRSRSDEYMMTSKEDSSRLKQGELDCEEAIIKDKERFGRVRNSLMRHLRGTYGEQTANRALWRVSKRITEGYLNPS